MDIVVTTIISSLFLVIAAAEPLAARLRLPYTAILAGIGIFLGSGATFLLNTELTDALNPVARAIVELPIRSDVFLYVFVSTLLFQATLGMNLRRMLEDWVPIRVLAIVAVVVATFSIVAEQTVGASGVIAVVTAGLSLKLAGPSRMPPVSWTNLLETWDLLAHWAGALTFTLAAGCSKRFASRMSC